MATPQQKLTLTYSPDETLLNVLTRIADSLETIAGKRIYEPVEITGAVNVPMAIEAKVEETAPVETPAVVEASPPAPPIDLAAMLTATTAAKSPVQAPVAKSTLTLEQITAELGGYVQSAPDKVAEQARMNQLQGLLTKYGLVTVTALPEEKFGVFMSDFQAIMAAGC